MAFSTFSDGSFDEQKVESRLTEDRMTVMVSRYWILKVQARFLSGDTEAGLAAAQKAKELHRSFEAFFQSLDYHYYTALTIAAVYEAAVRISKPNGWKVLIIHLNQLRQGQIIVEQRSWTSTVRSQPTRSPARP